MNIFDIISVYVALSAVLSPLIIFLIKKYIEAKVRHGFNKELEDHKHSLQITTKEVEYDYQRRIHDFSLFSSKKHEVYPKIYSLISDLHIEFGQATSALREYPDFRLDENFDRMEKYLIKKEVSKESIDHVRNEWTSNKDRGYIQFKIALDFRKILMADEKRMITYKEFVNNELFIVSNIVELINNFLDKVRLVLFEEQDRVLYSEYNGTRSEYYKKLREKRDEISSLKDDIKALIQKELSIGYYENKKDTES